MDFHLNSSNLLRQACGHIFVLASSVLIKILMKIDSKEEYLYGLYILLFVLQISLRLLYVQKN